MQPRRALLLAMRTEYGPVFTVPLGYCDEGPLVIEGLPAECTFAEGWRNYLSDSPESFLLEPLDVVLFTIDELIADGLPIEPEDAQVLRAHDFRMGYMAGLVQTAVGEARFYGPLVALADEAGVWSSWGPVGVLSVDEVAGMRAALAQCQGDGLFTAWNYLEAAARPFVTGGGPCLGEVESIGVLLGAYGRAATVLLWRSVVQAVMMPFASGGEIGLHSQYPHDPRFQHQANYPPGSEAEYLSRLYYRPPPTHSICFCQDAFDTCVQEMCFPAYQGCVNSADARLTFMEAQLQASVAEQLALCGNDKICRVAVYTYATAEEAQIMLTYIFERGRCAGLYSTCLIGCRLGARVEVSIDRPCPPDCNEIGVR